jgi:hypothetical protein
MPMRRPVDRARSGATGSAELMPEAKADWVGMAYPGDPAAAAGGPLGGGEPQPPTLVAMRASEAIAGRAKERGQSIGDQRLGAEMNAA